MPTQSSKPEVGKTIKLKVTEYSGKQKTVNGRATDVKDLGNGKYLVLAEYEPSEYYLSAVYHTQSAVVTVAGKTKAVRLRSVFIRSPLSRSLRRFYSRLKGSL